MKGIDTFNEFGNKGWRVVIGALDERIRRRRR